MIYKIFCKTEERIDVDTDHRPHILEEVPASTSESRNVVLIDDSEENRTIDEREYRNVVFIDESEEETETKGNRKIERTLSKKDFFFVLFIVNTLRRGEMRAAKLYLSSCTRYLCLY